MLKCKPGKGQSDLFLLMASVRCASVPASRGGAVCPAVPALTCPDRYSLQVFSVPSHSMFDHVLSGSPFLHLPGKREES